MTELWQLAVLQESQELERANPALIVVAIALVVFYAIVGWRVFEKAGQPGWTSLIPIVNYWFFAKAAGKAGWWGLLLFVPLANIVIWFILCIDFARRFRRGTGFGIGLALLGFIFFPILAFGDYEPGAAPGV